MFFADVFCFEKKKRKCRVLLAFTSSVYLQGPTEAERKIEELTRQLEEEMEKQEEEGEYFGK